LILSLGHAPTASAQESSGYLIVVDRDMTPAAGTTDLLTLERALVSAEDRVLPPRRFSETTSLRRVLGIAYRIGKFAAIDLPQDYFLMVVGHEVFGHGARLREIDAHGIGYRFDLPIPYGRGGASTDFDADVSATRADVLAIDTGGIEAQNVLAALIGREAVAHGALDYREAWQYLESRIDGLRYIRSVSPSSPPGHDVADFLRDFNDGCVRPTCTPLGGPALKRRALLMLADPLLAYGAYGIVISYAVHGTPSVAVPMIHLPHEIRYLPALRFEMAPYGTEWSTEHDVVIDGRLTAVSVRLGDTGSRRAWGVSMLRTDLARSERASVQLAADVWRQPPLDASPAARLLVTGGRAVATATVAFGRSDPARRIGLYVEGGYKSAGFVRGERLRSGAIARAGLAITR
jgi:hypothetical protein